MSARLRSAHLVFIEDERGDVVDYEVYCSDWCARTSPNWDGWNGCHEIETSTVCASCGTEIEGVERVEFDPSTSPYLDAALRGIEPSGDAYLVATENEDGHLIALEIYCSERCARTSPNYHRNLAAWRPWSGWHAIEGSTTCQCCGGHHVEGYLLTT
jgi:hypothetical protein